MKPHRTGKLTTKPRNWSIILSGFFFACVLLLLLVIKYPLSHNFPFVSHSKESTQVFLQSPIPDRYLKDPSGWLVKRKTDVQLGEEIIISKDGYQLTIEWPHSYEPGICIFEDQPEYKTYKGQMPQVQLCPGKFIEFTSKSGRVYRRLVKSKAPDEFSSKPRWTVYAKDAQNHFETVPPIEYVAPVDYDQAQIDVMDKILQSHSLNFDVE